MIWLALQALALAHGRRVSWRDLRDRAVAVPEQAMPEVAAVVLRDHGVTARVRDMGPASADLGGLHLPAALRLIGGEWLLLLSMDADQARVRRWPAGGAHETPDQGSPVHGRSDEQPHRDESIRLEKLLALHDGLCIDVADGESEGPFAGDDVSAQDALSAVPPDGRNWFWSVFSRLRAHYGDCILAAVLVNVLALAGTMFSMNVYDRIIPNAAMHSLWTLAVGVVLAALLELGLRALRAHVLDDAGKRADVALSASLIRQTLNLRPADRPASSGQWASQIREFDAVRDFVSSTTLVALTDLPFALLFLVVVAWIGGHLVWITLLAGVLTVLVGVMAQARIRKSVERYQYESTQKHAYLIEILERLETIDALGAAASVQGRWERLCASSARSSMATRMASAMTGNAAMFIQQAANVALIVTGVYLILAGQLTVGALIGCSMLASRVLSPLGQVAGLMARWHNTRMSFQQIDRLMNLPQKHDPLQTFVSWPKVEKEKPLEISLQGVRFRYPKTEHDVLSIDNLQLKAGQIVAVTGPVGSGKSTLLRVLAGLQSPTEGRLMVAGLAASQISPAEWRDHVAWVGQDAVLFRGSLRENLLLSSPHVSDERFIHILRLCGLDGLVAAHPQGLDMQVGEGGQALSGGQRQWVALARALLSPTPVLLLDEPTSAMDMAFERILLERLRPEFAGRLIVVTTHRPGPLALADRLLVLDAGRVVADGPRDAVLSSIAEGRVARAPQPQPGALNARTAEAVGA